MLKKREEVSLFFVIIEMEELDMGLFGGQLANVVEWEEYRDDILFWKWTNKEIKKGSKLIII